MFRVIVDKNIARLEVQENMTSGSKNVYLVRFDLSKDWSDLAKTAVFRRGSRIINVLLDDTNECMIPWEILVDYGVPLDIGIFGTKDSTVVLPTIWVRTDLILEGVVTGIDCNPPTPTIYEQLLARLLKVESGGKSAFDVAVDNGFVGTEQDWLESLGGKSAFELAVEDGFTGTIRDWFNSLRGDPGDPGLSAYGIAVANGFQGTVLEWLKSLEGSSSFEIALKNGFVGTEDQWIKTIMGAATTKLNVYSYDELYVGTWADGKPIYRKVFTGKATPNNTISIGSISPNLETVTKRNIVYKDTDGNFVGAECGATIKIARRGQVDITTTDIEVDYNVTIEYTKRTDIPWEPPHGSGDVEEIEIEFGHGLKVTEDKVVEVDTYDDTAANPDETLPIDADGVTSIIDDALTTIENVLENM